jgi:hypothetical protein
MTDKPHIEKRKPWISGIGFALLLVAVGGGILTINHANEVSPGYGGMGAGFAVIGLWMIIIPLSFVLGVISWARNESPRILSRILLILSAVPILYFLVVIGSSS